MHAHTVYVAQLKLDNHKYTFCMQTLTTFMRQLVSIGCECIGMSLCSNYVCTCDTYKDQHYMQVEHLKKKNLIKQNMPLEMP